MSVVAGVGTKIAKAPVGTVKGRQPLIKRTEQDLAVVRGLVPVFEVYHRFLLLKLVLFLWVAGIFVGLLADVVR